MSVDLRLHYVVHRKFAYEQQNFVRIKSKIRNIIYILACQPSAGSLPNGLPLRSLALFMVDPRASIEPVTTNANYNVLDIFWLG